MDHPTYKFLVQGPQLFSILTKEAQVEKTSFFDYYDRTTLFTNCLLISAVSVNFFCRFVVYRFSYFSL
jgi:hypothetical protein